MSEKFRCFGTGSSIYEDYHDNEWGRPVYDDYKLFEMLVLEGMQAGLSWITVLKKRENYKKAFDNFNPKKIVLYDETKVEELMLNEGIIRNRLKINSIIINAKLFLKIMEKGSFSDMLWEYVAHKPIVGHYRELEEIPVTTAISDKMSKDLRKMGFKFAGSTIIYSFMQAVGMVNDHLIKCCVYEDILNDKKINKL